MSKFAIFDNDHGGIGNQTVSPGDVVRLENQYADRDAWENVAPATPVYLIRTDTGEKRQVATWPSAIRGGDRGIFFRAPSQTGEYRLQIGDGGHLSLAGRRIVVDPEADEDGPSRPPRSMFTAEARLTGDAPEYATVSQSTQDNEDSYLYGGPDNTVNTETEQAAAEAGVGDPGGTQSGPGAEAGGGMGVGAWLALAALAAYALSQA